MTCTSRQPASEWPVLILAGGRGNRLGGCDKAALPAPDDPKRSLLASAIERLAVLGPVWIASGPTRRADLASTQRQLLDPSWLASADSMERAGPLAGLQAGFAHALEQAPNSILLSCPVDLIGLRCELLRELAERLQAQPQLQVLVARRDRQPEPLVAAWRVDAGLLEQCELALRQGQRAVHRWQQSLRQAHFQIAADAADWINLNTAEDLLRAAGRYSVK